MHPHTSRSHAINTQRAVALMLGKALWQVEAWQAKLAAWTDDGDSSRDTQLTSVGDTGYTRIVRVGMQPEHDHVSQGQWMSTHPMIRSGSMRSPMPAANGSPTKV